ncbi:hypothetical protein B0H11DRAFT_2111070 [Mycena galericulata]|nr:hypothetical protein B0H11DRAFT_2111070 [Mycena galericulata]
MWYPQDSFTLRGTFMADTPPCDIYLFLFRPRMDWVAGYPVFEIPPPSEALYWSLDPGGTTRLTSTMAEELGVPYVFLESYVTGVSWTQREYNMVAEFHDAKGFHPFSRDVATHLGYPLVEERPCPPTSLSEVDLEAVEYAKTALQTYPKQAFRGSAPRCLHCGGRQPGIKNVVLPDLEVPPIHRHRKYRNVIIRAG